jgi:hypothetical protein
MICAADTRSNVMYETEDQTRETSAVRAGQCRIMAVVSGKKYNPVCHFSLESYFTLRMSL